MRFRLALPIVVLLLAPTACGRVLCDNPLTSPAEAKADSRLRGLYSIRGTQPDLVYLLPRKNSATVDVIFIDRAEPKSGRETSGAWRCDAFPSRLGGRTYLNARSCLPDSKNGVTAPSDRYDIVRYEFGEDGVLVIRLMNTGPVVEAIDSGQLTGKRDCTGGVFSECKPLVSAKSAELAAFVASTDDASLFKEEHRLRPVPFPKLSDAAQE
jgi:hypothetical protein